MAEVALALPDVARIERAMQSSKLVRDIREQGHVIEPNQCVGVRLNLNLQKSCGVNVSTIHRSNPKHLLDPNKGSWNGKVLDFRPIVVLRHAHFKVNQLSRMKIVSRRSNKFPMATIDGQINFEIEPFMNSQIIRFNPCTSHLFTEASTGFAVRYAEYVTVLGGSVFASGRIIYYQEDQAPTPRKGWYSDVKFAS